jgi:hypothetical protein
MWADTGIARTAPVTTQIAIAPAKTLTRRLMDLRIRASEYVFSRYAGPENSFGWKSQSVRERA